VSSFYVLVLCKRTVQTPQSELSFCGMQFKEVTVFPRSWHLNDWQCTVPPRKDLFDSSRKLKIRSQFTTFG